MHIALLTMLMIGAAEAASQESTMGLNNLSVLVSVSIDEDGRTQSCKVLRLGPGLKKDDGRSACKRMLDFRWNISNLVPWGQVFPFTFTTVADLSVIIN